MPKVIKNDAFRLFVKCELSGIAVTGIVTATMVVKKADLGSADFETLTATTHYTVDEMSGGWYGLDIVAAVLDTVGETIIEISHASAAFESKIYSLDVVDFNGIRKNVALANFTFPMYLESDHATLGTGKVVTGTIRKDAGAFGAIAGAISEVGTTGTYTVNLSAAEMNADMIELLFENADCDPLPIVIKTNI